MTRADLQFDDLFREHFPRLVGLGMAMTGSPDTARELAQETMLRAHARWPEVGGLERPGSWLRKVMTNLLIDHHRRGVSETTALGRLAPPADHSPADAVDDADAWHQLMATLPMRQRAIVALHYGEDCSVEEIAKVLDISSGTVKSALSKARQTLMESLTERPGQEGGRS